MSEEWPKITSRKIIKISQWMDLMARDVEFSKGDAPQTYYAVSQLDYLAILAVTPDGFGLNISGRCPPATSLIAGCMPL